MSDVSGRIAGLSADKRKLLAKRLLASKSSAAPRAQAILRRQDPSSSPLSFTQERLWFMNELHPGTTMYTMAGANRIYGPFDEDIAIRAFNEIVHRHEVLRTTFKFVDGHPVSVVAPNPASAPYKVDLRHLPPDKREAEAQRLIQEEIRRPFDLSQGPLIRFSLLRLADEEFIGTLVMHHMIADGWSTKVLFREFAALYQAFSHNQPSPLPELPIQYGDYALWQRQWLQGEALESQLDYWQQQFGDDNAPMLDLPTDRPWPAVPTFGGARYSFALPSTLARRIQDLSRQEGVTLFMTLLAGFETLLHRYTRQDKIVIGTPISGRQRAEVEGLVGCFLNMLPLRTDVSGNPTFRELLRRVQEVALGAYAHQDLPFEKLVDALQPERTLSRAPICQVAFSYEDDPTQAVTIQNLRMQFAEVHTGATQMDLALELTETKDAGGAPEIAGWLEYNTDVFDASTIQRMAKHLQMLLEGIVADPEQRLSDLLLLTGAERHQLLVEWNDTARDYPRDVCLHQLFEAQAERTPEAAAVICDDRSISYRELNGRANQLAHHLIAQGVGPETFVGLCLERSIEMIVGVLGILKAGGAYVPIDPQNPRERLAFILSDSRGKVVVTQAKFVDRLPVDKAQLVCLDRDGETIARQSQASPHSNVTADNLAYVLYTSGSTGRPKGVSVAHRDVVHHTLFFAEFQGLLPSDRMLMFVSMIYDAAAAALHPALAVGATVVLPSVASSELSGGELLRICQEGQVTVIHLPVAFWQQWVDDLATRQTPFNVPVRVTMVGGECPSVSKAQTWFKIVGRPIRFINAYGPTEAVITITLYEVPGDDASLQKMRSIPAGRPIANKRMYLLDSHLQPVPVGVPGEVYAGGIGVARDYLNHPEATAEKFIPDPFSDQPGARMYRTGDLARYLPDGNLEFIGRVDQQVKIRGIRIEPGEVEAVLGQHPAVLQSIVIPQKDGAGNWRLVAYIVAGQQPAPSVEEMRSFIKDSLPEPMIPSAFVFMEAFPLSDLGKVNRRALPAPDWDKASVQSEFVAPRTPLEQQLAQIWAQVIGARRVGVFDNFFELGGHSLLAVQLVARIREALQIELPMRSLFETPTVAGLAVAIGQQKGEQKNVLAALPAIKPDPDRYSPFPLNDVQQAYWIGRSDMLELGNISCHGYVEFDGVDLDLSRLSMAWQKLVERHDMLRAFILPDGRQQILPHVPPYQIEVLDLRGKDPQEVLSQLAMIRQEMSHQVIPAERWPLFEIRATRLDERRYRLHTSVDLLIADAWSFTTLLQELDQFYQHPDLALPPLEISFRDYVLAEIPWRETAIYQQSLEYWQRRLATLPPGPELPLAQNPASVKQPRFERRTFRLSPEAWLRLKSRAAQAGLTPSGVLLTAYAEILAMWSSNPRFTLNLTFFNRLPIHPQVNAILGDFTSIILLEVDNSVGNSFEARARRIQEQLWQDLDHRYVSGIHVQRELMRMGGGASRATMPIVFTSTLSLDAQVQPPAWLGEMVYAIGQTPQVWLDHVVSEENGTLVCNWDAVEELFPEGLLEDMFNAYCNLLESLINEEQTWQQARLQLIPAKQLAQRAAINATESPVSAHLLHTLFAEQVSQRPHQAAVISSARTLTYEELYRYSHRIGRHLKQLGARPNTLVAVVMEKGWEQVAAVMGILQSGAAYLPIDTNLPKERLWYLLEHGQASLALTQSWLNDRLEWPPNVQRFCVDGDDFMMVEDQPFETVQGPEDLAYVIYTSGSTGLPKGVVIDHRGAVNTILDINQRFAVGPQDRVLALSSLNFDLSVYDIFGLLAAGGTIVLPDAASQREPSHWAELIERQQVTLWDTVPALMGMLVEYVGGRQQSLPPSLRLVMMSGDWIPVALPDQIRALAENAQIISLGGATEASIWSILYPIEKVDPIWKSIPYGRPMVNQTFHTLDKALEPRPVWVPGQLYIGGIGLAKGYWRDEEKTNASFISHPRTGERLYRTGDLGRYWPDGNIEFLGREDFQVKVQGYRIELGEIEAALSEHPQVHAVVVTALGKLQGDKRLVAYIVAEEGSEISIADLRQFLRSKLPEYMVPSVFVPMKSLPLSPNGKVDRKALPAPEAVGVEQEKTFVAPRTPVETSLTEIWTKVLNLPQVGIYDNFFELGGNSVQVVQIVSRLRELFQIELPMRTVFETPCIAQLAEKIEVACWASQQAQAITRAAGEDREEGEL